MAIKHRRVIVRKFRGKKKSGLNKFQDSNRIPLQAKSSESLLTMESLNKE